MAVDDPRLKEAFKVAVDTRKFEIELFWKRSTFFWAFNAVAFAGFVTLAQQGALGLSLLVAGFGLVSAVGWAMVNLGSKLWYENWEIKTKELEGSVTGPLFGTVSRKPAEKQDCWAVRARRFSVSKITILISYYVVLIWIAAFAFQVFDVFAGNALRDDVLRLAEPTFAGVTIASLVLLVCLGRSRGDDL